MRNSSAIRLDQRLEDRLTAIYDRLAQSRWTVNDADAEAILLDDQVEHAFNQLVGGITSNEWVIEHPDARIVAFIEDMLEGLRPGGQVGGGVIDIIKTMCKAIILGRVHLNYRWEIVQSLGGAYVPRAYWRIPNTKITIAPTGNLLFQDVGNRMEITSEDPIKQKQLRRWVPTLPWGSDGNPFGDPLARKIWWIVEMRRDNGMSNWSVGMERFGLPSIVGRMGGNPTDAQLAEFRDMLKELRNQFAVAVREGDNIEMISPNVAWDANIYQLFLLYMDRQIDKAILGQPGTSGDRGETGTFAETKVHATVRLDIVSSVSTWISGCITQLIEDVLSFPLNRVLFPTNVPAKFRIVVPDAGFVARSENIKWAYERGIELDRAEFYSVLQVKDPVPQADKVIKKVEPVATPSFPIPFRGEYLKGDSCGCGDRHIHLASGNGDKPDPKTLQEWSGEAAHAHAEEAKNAYQSINDRIDAGLDAVGKGSTLVGQDAARIFTEAATQANVSPSMVEPFANMVTQGQLVGRSSVQAGRELIREAITPSGAAETAFGRSLQLHDLMDANKQLDYFVPPSEISQIFNDPLIITKDKFIETLANNRRWGFYIQNAESQNQVKAVADILADAYKQGRTFADVRDELANTLQGKAFSQSRIETIFRTNMSQAMNMGAYARQVEPDILKDTAAWVYSNPADHRSRPSHRAMNGFMASPQNKIWKAWYPPNGYRCRCTIITQWRDELKGKEQKDMDWPTLLGVPVQPDPGFENNTAALFLGGAFTELV